jgi:hypothetical protein
MVREAASQGQFVADLLQDLEAARTRLKHRRENPLGGETALAIFALSREVKWLCREASRCADAAEVESLLARSTQSLEELQRLLGVH